MQHIILTCRLVTTCLNVFYSLFQRVMTMMMMARTKICVNWNVNTDSKKLWFPRFSRVLKLSIALILSWKIFDSLELFFKLTENCTSYNSCILDGLATYLVRYKMYFGQKLLFWHYFSIYLRSRGVGKISWLAKDDSELNSSLCPNF